MTSTHTIQAPGKIPLLRADPHRWGMGKVHQIDPTSDRTLCGQTPARCPGEKFLGTADQTTCGACQQSLEIRERNRQWERERQEENRRWWVDYNGYLQTDVWRFVLPAMKTSMTSEPMNEPEPVTPRPRRSREVYAVECYRCHRSLELPATGGPCRCYHCGALLLIEWGKPR